MKNRKLAPALVTVVFLLSTSVQNVLATEIVIVDNGSGSDNTVVFQQETTQQVEQNNQTNITNDVDIQANTGNNTTSGNTGGDSTIQTGDTNVDTSIQNEANSSTASTGCCENEGSDVNISGNGSDSTNTVSVTNTNNTNVNVNQTANINNNVNIKSNTGHNEASYNNGDSTIKTGDIKINGGITNGPISSSNVDVKSGNQGADVSVKGNGSGSENLVYINQYSNQNVNVNNNANILNNLYFDLNTGKNKSILNNGNSFITTGDIILDFFLNNGPINSSDVDIDCCGKANPDDKKDDDDKDKDDDKGNGGDNGEDKDNGGDDGDEEDKEGQITSEAASDERGGDKLAAVLGLSDTSSGGSGFNLLFWLGLFGLAFGLKMIGEEISSKSAVSVITE